MTEQEDGRSAIRLIAINRTLREECERQLPALEAAKAPAEEEEILTILVRHAPAYGVTAKSDAEWSSFFGSYLEALRGVPAQAIEDAFNRWNRGEGHKDIRMAGFYPKPAQLVILAEKAKQSLYGAAYRARRAMEYAEEQAPRQIPEEERRRVAEEFKALAASMGRRGMPGLARPTVSPQQMAAQLREAAHNVAPADDVGDVV